MSKDNLNSLDGPSLALRMEMLEERMEALESQLQKPQRCRSPRFVAPSLQEVKEYCQSRQSVIDAEKWFDYYQSNGWRLGGNKPMFDWQASVRTWERYQKERQNGELFGPNKRAERS